MAIRISGSTGISGVDGTAQTPAMQGSNPNAGVYYSGNTVIVSTSGTNALTIGPTGNVALTNNNFSIAGQNVSPYSGMMKNRIINGDFRIDQRFCGNANNCIYAGQYVVDRWYTYSMVSAKYRSQQNNNNGPTTQALTQAATGFSNYFGTNTLSANASFGTGDQYFLGQLVEGSNIQDLNWGTSVASPVTLSFWVYSSVPGTHGGTICNGTAARSFPFSYTINAANTWQYQTITVPGDTTGSWWSNNNIGMYVLYNLGSGSSLMSSSGNSWQSGFYQTVAGTIQPQSYSNGSFYLTGVQLEKGSQATSFDWRHYTTELQLCERYYQKSADPTTLPGTAQVGLQYIPCSGTYVNGAVWGYVPYRTKMRQSALIMTWSYNGTVNRWSAGDASDMIAGVTTIWSQASSSSGFSFINNSGSSITPTYGGTYGSWVASAELGTQN